MFTIGRGWISREDLTVFLLLFARVASYDIQDFDLDAIEYGITKTSSDDDKWFTYEFLGHVNIPFELALDTENDDIIFYHLTFPEELAKCVQFAEGLVADFKLTPRY